MSGRWTLAAVLVAVVAAATGGYLLGSASAPAGDEEIADADEVLRAAFSEALLEAVPEGARRGYRIGAGAGRLEGRRVGARAGYLAGQSSAEAELAGRTGGSSEAEPGVGGLSVRGADVLVVGDSLEELTGPYLEDYLPAMDVTVSAVTGYSSTQIFDLFVASYEPSHDVIVFDAGTNDDPSYPQMLASNLEAVAEIAGDRCMVVPTIHAPAVNGVDQSAKNEVVAAFAASRPGTQVPDWAGAVAANPELMQSDNLHPLPEGAALRARLIAHGVRACLQLR